MVWGIASYEIARHDFLLKGIPYTWEQIVLGILVSESLVAETNGYPRFPIDE
jgi:hypothetical protein